MNNDQFRRLLLDPSKQSSNLPAGKSNPTDHGPKKAPSSLLGANRARPRSSVSMAPRTVKPAAAGRKSSQFRSVVPKGSRLADGFVDRTGTRRGDDEDKDDVATRVAALEESLKEGEIDEAAFTRMRDEITGGRLEHTHLVKGLDWKLLERVRRGEDVRGESSSPAVAGGEHKPEEGAEVDDEFDRLQRTEVVAVARENTAKKGELAKLSGVTGKRTRDEILAALKASRKRAAEEQGPELGTKFRKIGAAEEAAPRLEIDARGREVLFITEADGTVKRKVRKRREEQREALPMPDEDAVPLGADVAIVEAPKDDSDEGDIYADIGDDYDPLGGIGEDDDSSGDSDAEDRPTREDAAKTDRDKAPDAEDRRVQPTQSAPRNYFNDDPSLLSVLDKVTNPLNDPAVLAALAKKHKEKEDEQGELAKKEAERKAALVRARDRDMEDMDMGFGASRFDDEEEMAMEGSKVKLSEWNDGKEVAYDDDDGGKGDKKKRKRKRKGDKNSVADVLRVIESRK
jgi:hypothetical protein